MLPTREKGPGSAVTRLRACRRAGFAVGTALGLLLAPWPLPGQTTTTPEYRAKANFLANLPSFVDWPASVFPSRETPFLICVFGDFSVGTSLVARTHALDYRGRRIEVRWVHKVSGFSSCQILFVSRGDTKCWAKVLDAVRGQSVLTVGENSNFLDSGGAVAFVFQPSSPNQCEINLDWWKAPT